MSAPNAGPGASRKPLRWIGLVLLALLGFALAASVHSQRASSQLATARPDDLVRILDDLDSRSTRLRSQISTLERTRDQLASPGSESAALAEARQRTQDLGILAGTIAAHGPGIILTITDPQHSVGTDVVVDVVEELRDAGAETIEIAGVRLGATSWVGDTGNGLSVDGHAVSAPYVVRAIGDPDTMERALQIPGGVVDTVNGQPGASAKIVTSSDVRITSLRPLPSPGYAQPSPR
jgi:uncharacterized protein YlxW (UPF0749 family)